MRFIQAASGIAALLSGVASASPLQSNVYDYIVVGGGPSGIITAERFAEAGKKVLLLERGSGPTAATGSNDTLSWDSSLTGIDVPGLSYSVAYTDAYQSYLCKDTAYTAACVLGGGVTVNYMVFVHPAEHDFNDKWPQGWKWNDVASAADRLYSRNPGSVLPSADGRRYDQSLYKMFSGFLDQLGWKSVDMKNEPNKKHQVYSYPAWNIKDQKRAGPVRSYLPLTHHLPNFALSLNTKALRLVRCGSKVTGVEVQTASGKNETVSVAPGGRVVLSAGTMSTPRLLFNSGIGPEKQIETARKSGVQVPPQHQWLNLPVGIGYKDHPMFVLYVKTNDSSIMMLDGESVINGTDTRIIEQYRHGSGILTQGKHRLIFFTSNVVDGEKRFYQGSLAPDEKPGVFSISAYLTHGLTSSGVLGLDARGNTVVEKSPYLQTEGDRKATGQFFEQLIGSIQAPSSGMKIQGSTNISAIMENWMTGTHFVGTAVMGEDNRTSVVDTNTKVHGVDNLVCLVPSCPYVDVSMLIV